MVGTHQCGIQMGNLRMSMFGLYMRSGRSSLMHLSKNHWLCTRPSDRNMQILQLSYYKVACPNQ